MNRILLACLALAPSFVVAAPCDILSYANQCQGSNLWPVPAGWAADNNGDCQPQPPYYLPKQWAEVDRADNSLGTWCWVNNYASPLISIPRTALTVGESVGRCAGTAPNGAPVVVRCNEPGYILGGLYTCSSTRNVYHGNTVAGTLPDAAMGPITDGYNPSYCSKYSAGFEALTRCNEVYVGGGRWGCPAGSVTWDKDGNGSFYMADGQNVEACRAYLPCPTGYHEDYPGSQSCYINSGETTKPANGRCTARWTSSAQTAIQKDSLDPDCDASSCVFDGTCRLR